MNRGMRVFAASAVVLSMSTLEGGQLQGQEHRPVSEETTELLAVYIGATDCAPCVQPRTKEVVRALLERLEGHAERAGWAFSKIGVSTDTDLRAGMGFLESTADFDEVIHRERVGQHGGPGVCLEFRGRVPSAATNCRSKEDAPNRFHRKADTLDGRVFLRTPSYGPQEVLLRRTGSELAKWMESGESIPVVGG